MVSHLEGQGGGSVSQGETRVGLRSPAHPHAAVAAVGGTAWGTMKDAEFAEAQYEASVCIELARGGAAPFRPSPRLEYRLAFDLGADPASTHAIWRILRVHAPQRIAIAPDLWPGLPRRFHARLSGRMCSLFLQLKVPIYQDGNHARYRRRFRCPYFQVGVTRMQQRRLRGLERRAGNLALVRYASPAFWSRRDFDTHDSNRTVLSNSAFISPRRIRSHSAWMYASPTGMALLNPSPEYVDQEPWDVVLRAINRRATRQTLREHVRALASRFERDEPPAVERDGWLQRLERYARLSPEDKAYLADLAVVSRVAEMADAAWVVLLEIEPDMAQLVDDERRWWPYWFWP